MKKVDMKFEKAH